MPEQTLNTDLDFIFESDTFDGPLDLLLYLIKKDEIDIYDIPIAEITRQFLAYLEACRELNLEIAGEFLFMAAMLIRIKAQMLLPRPEDDETWEDPRSELVKALLEYRKVKKISAALDDLADNMKKRFYRRDFSAWNISPPEPELVKLDLATLMIAFGDMMRRMKFDNSLEIRAQEITVESRKQHIISLFNSEPSLEFEELFADDPRKIVMVVTLVALLDMVKDGTLKIEQADRFMTIRVFLNKKPYAVAEER